MKNKASSDTGPGKQHRVITSLAPADDGWLATGHVYGAGSSEAWLVCGASGGQVRWSRRLPLAGVHPLGMARIDRRRLAVVGEEAQPGSAGPLGHPLFRAVVLVITEAGELVSTLRPGAPGVTGLTAVAVHGSVIFAGGQQSGVAWVAAFSADAAETLWEREVPGLDDVRAFAVGPREIAVAGQLGATTTGPGHAAVHAFSAGGQPAWSWQATDGPSELYALAAREGGGWLAAGRSLADERNASRVFAVAEGKALWSLDLAPPGATAVGYQSARALVAGPGAREVLVAGELIDDGGRRDLWVQRLAGDGTTLGPARVVGRAAAVRAALSGAEGWIVAGHHQAPSGLRPLVCGLDPAGATVWTAEVDFP